MWKEVGECEMMSTWLVGAARPPGDVGPCHAAHIV